MRLTKEATMRKWFCGAFVTTAVLFVFTSPVGAEDVAISDEVVVGGEHVITIPYVLWSAVVGLMLPVVIALVSKLNAKPIVKIVLNLALSAVSGLVGTVVVADGVAVLSSSAVVIAAMTFIQSLAMYLGFWAPLNAPAKLAPNTGVG